MDRTQLSGWYEEFAVIEQMVEDYDLGDLASLRKFAASEFGFHFRRYGGRETTRWSETARNDALTRYGLGSSKRDLSNEDTDLLEVTLTTLLSLDRLLSLLRHRHQQLDLLTYRIRCVVRIPILTLADLNSIYRWEEQLGLAWKEYRRILADLPPLIQRSRWTRPAVATNPQSTTFHESLSADLVAYTSHIDALLNSTIPAAAHHLDKIIDTSPVALPDSFLESQESLEDAAGDLTTGLGTFIGKVGRQTERLNGHWRGLEGIGRSLEGVERALNGIGETGMPLGEYDVYAIPLGVARTDLDRIKAETKEFAASLFHPAVPDQATNTTDVLSVIFARHEELVAISDTIAQRLAGFQHDAVLLSEKVDKEETVRLAEEDSERRTREEGDLAREMSEARMYSFRHSVELIKIEEFDHVLPSLIQLDDLIHQVSLARTLYEPLNPAERNQVLESHLELERKESHLATLQSLIKLGEMVVLVDHAISDLLESIDVANGLDPLPSEIDPATPTRPLLPLDVARTHAIDSVDAVRSEAATIDDMRSIVQLTRLEGILAEMLEFADEAVVPRPPVIFEHSVDSPRPSSIRARSISASSSRPPSSRASSRLSLLSTTEEGRCETTLAGNDSIFTPTSSRSIITPPPRSQIPRQSLNKSNGMHTALEIGIGRPGGLSRSISNSGSALGVPTSSASAMGMKRSTRAVSSPSPRVGGSSGSIGSMGRPRVASNESTRSNRASLSSSASRASLSGGMGREKEKVGPVRFVPRRKDRVVDIEVARIISENSVSAFLSSFAALSLLLYLLSSPSFFLPPVPPPSFLLSFKKPIDYSF